ncbi:MAG TPA: endonuclease V [Pseudonocardiaceae bacterium]|nr:endonuclease V [Pseudonocardiaceae bacterium]
MQLELRPLVSTTTPDGLVVRTAAGLDVSYAPDSDRLVAAVVVVDVAELWVVDSVVVHGESRFPYVPGLFAFRELPALVEALARLTVTPDLLVCDGQGIAHPRRFGLACHVGVLTGLPTVGVAKTPLGRYAPPGEHRGDRTPLVLDGDVVGSALRTQNGVRPVFVSPGHRIDVDRACTEVLRLAPRYRLPETTRQADHLSRQALAGAD